MLRQKQVRFACFRLFEEQLMKGIVDEKLVKARKTAYV